MIIHLISIYYSTSLIDSVGIFEQLVSCGYVGSVVLPQTYSEHDWAQKGVLIQHLGFSKDHHFMRKFLECPKLDTFHISVLIHFYRICIDFVSVFCSAFAKTILNIYFDAELSDHYKDRKKACFLF